MLSRTCRGGDASSQSGHPRSFHSAVIATDSDGAASSSWPGGPVSGPTERRGRSRVESVPSPGRLGSAGTPDATWQSEMLIGALGRWTCRSGGLKLAVSPAVRPGCYRNNCRRSQRLGRVVCLPELSENPGFPMKIAACVLPASGYWMEAGGIEPPSCEL